MPKLPVLNSKKVIKILREHGFLLDHTMGSHFVFYHPDDKKIVTVPHHNRDIPKGTLISILRQAGISKDEI